MALGIVSALVDVVKAPVIRDRLRRLVTRPGVGDETDTGNGLIAFDHEVIRVTDPLDAGRTGREAAVNPLRPEIRRLEHVGVR